MLLLRMIILMGVQCQGVSRAQLALARSPAAAYQLLVPQPVYQLAHVLIDVLEA